MAEVSEKEELKVVEKPFHPKGGKRLVRNSPKMEIAARMMGEAIARGDSMSKGELLRRAGYSKTVQRTPQKVTEKLSFQECLDKYLPISKIVRRHTELMDSVEDNVALKAAELGYRVRGHIVQKSAHLHANVGDVNVSWSDT